MLSNINFQGHVYVFYIPEFLTKLKHKSDFLSLRERRSKPEETDREAAFPPFFTSPRTATCAFHKVGLSCAALLTRVCPRVFSWNYLSLWKVTKNFQQQFLVLNNSDTWTQLEIKLISSSAIILFLTEMLLDFLSWHPNTPWRTKIFKNPFTLFCFF